MIAVDTNILVYAHRQDSEWHEKALQSLIGLTNGKSRWGIPWSCVHEFIAISTHPKIYAPSTPLAKALDCINTWLSHPTCVPLSEGYDYFPVLTELAVKGKIEGAMIHDARIAAICLYNGVTTLWTVDRDFSRFPKLKTSNPLL